ncbi:MAG: DUF1285 domain-containing protein [Psychromonas sp.]
MLDLSLIPSEDEQKLPPVHLWKPDFCGDIDMLIKANGEWFHEGGLLRRPAMVKMFSRILWYEKGEYFLVTPVEKVRIKVEDAPFLVKQYQSKQHPDGLYYIEFLTITGDKLTLGKNGCSLWLENFNGQAKPYVAARYDMKASISRQVYYALVELGVARDIDGQSHHFIQSGNEFFSLGLLEEE